MVVITIRSTLQNSLYLARPLKEFDLKPVEQADMGKLDSFKEKEKKEEEKAKDLSKADEKIFDKLLLRIKDILGDRVTEVRESKRLHDSASCLVNPDGSMTSHMHKMMQMMNKMLQFMAGKGVKPASLLEGQ